MISAFHIREYLYEYVEDDLRRSGEKQFDYVAPSNREVQKEMEKACTAHLKRVGAWLDGPLPDAPEPDTPAHFVSALGNTGAIGNAPEQTGFPVTASVIIPVFNRVRTIGDAVRSRSGVTSISMSLSLTITPPTAQPAFCKSSLRMTRASFI